MLSAQPHSDPSSLLRLLQLASPTLPVGAYTYSEGLETLVNRGNLPDATTVQHWLTQELRQGAVRLDGAGMVAAMRATAQAEWAELAQTNATLSALRDSRELREQQWQMGRSLSRLLQDLEPLLAEPFAACGTPCNFAIAFGIAAQHWQIAESEAALAYLQSWASNLITAAVRLIPLGQTVGQQVLLALAPTLEETAALLQTQSLDQLAVCNWGLAIASMNHETLYSRLFRS